MKFAVVAALFLAASAQAQSTIFHEDFENGYSNWTMTGLWNAQDSSEACTLAQTPFPSGTHCVWYGAPATCNFVNPDWAATHVLAYTPVIQLPATTGSLALRFRSLSEAENDGLWDARLFRTTPHIPLEGGGPQVRVFNSDRWVQLTYDITYLAGGPMQLDFAFWAGDETQNNGLGWLLDDIEIIETPGPALTICAGDGNGYACPCDNTGGAGRGCASSLSSIGAMISATGSPSTAAQDLTLHMDGMSPAAATVFQASFGVHFNNPNIAGDGLSCVSGTFIRLATRFAPDGNLDFPSAGDASIVTMGMVTPYKTRFYAARYRDSAAFCTPATFNMTNTISVTWRP